MVGGKLTTVEVKHSSSAEVLDVIWGVLSVHLKQGDECLLTDSGVDGESSHGDSNTMDGESRWDEKREILRPGIFASHSMAFYTISEQ